MKKTFLMAALLSGVVMAAGAVSAQPDQRERPDFATLDTNGDGALTLEELQARGEARFAEMDTDGDGALSAEELIAQANAQAEDRVARMIERMDENGDGALQADEMKPRGDRGERNMDRMFDRMDADEDGVISAEEFAAAQEKMAERGGRHDRGNGRDHGRDHGRDGN